MADIITPEAPKTSGVESFVNPLDAILERAESERDHPANPLGRILDDPVNVFLSRSAKEGRPVEEVKSGLDALGVDSKGVEGDYRLNQAREKAKNYEESPLFRAVSKIPYARKFQEAMQEKIYTGALQQFQQGNYGDMDVSSLGLKLKTVNVPDTIAMYEEYQRRKQQADTRTTVREAALDVPAMIAEFGMAGKALGPLGLGTPTTQGLPTAVRGAQYLGKAAATAAASGMTTDIAQQRAVQQAQEQFANKQPVTASMTDLNNMIPAQALGMIQAAVLGSMAKMPQMGWMQGVPTVPLRAGVAAAVGTGETVAADTVGSIADATIGQAVGKDWRLNTKWGGVVRDAAMGKEGSGKELLAQLVTFSMFSGAHDIARRFEKVPPTKANLEQMKGTPIEAAKQFINEGGTPEEAVTINQQFMELINDPRTAGNAFELMKDKLNEQKASDNAKAYAKLLAENVLPAIERYKAAEQPITPEDYAKQKAKEPGEYDPAGDWKDMGFAPIESWPDDAVRQVARDVGLDHRQPVKVLREQVMDRFAEEQQRLNSAREPRGNPWDLNAPSRPVPVHPEKAPVPPEVAQEPRVTPQSPETAPESPRIDAAAPVSERPGEVPNGPPVKPPAAAPGVPPAPAAAPALTPIERQRQAQANRPPVQASPTVPPIRPKPVQVENSPTERPPVQSRGKALPDAAVRARLEKQLADMKYDLQNSQAEVLGEHNPTRRFHLKSAVKVLEQSIQELQAKLDAHARSQSPRPVEPVAPLDALRQQLLDKGLTPREAHVLIEVAKKNRTLTDIGADAPLRKKKGAIGLSKKRVSELSIQAVEKAGPELVAEIQKLVGGRGPLKSMEPREGGRGKNRTPEEARIEREERQQDAATELYTRLPDQVREHVDANIEQFLLPDGRWRIERLQGLADRAMPRTAKDVQPLGIRRIARDRLVRVVNEAKKNPGPEALRRIRGEEAGLLDLLREQGEKQPHKVLKELMPKWYEDVKKAMGQLKELKQRAGEEPFQYEERKREAAGATTLYRDVMSRGGLDADSLANNSVDVQKMKEGPLKNLVKKSGSTDRSGKRPQAVDTLAKEMLNSMGEQVPSNLGPVEHFLNLIASHRLVEEGHWNEKVREKQEAQRALFDDAPKEKSNATDFDPASFGDASDLLKRKIADNADNWDTHGITAAKNQMAGEQNGVTVGVVAKARGLVKGIWDDYRKMAGNIAPAVTDLSARAGNSIARFIAANTYGKLLTPDLIDNVMGPNATPEARMRVGAVLTEMRLRHMRDAYLKAGDVEAAEQVKSIVGQTKPGGDPLSSETPLLNEADFQRLSHDPDVLRAIENFRKFVVPIMEKNYRLAEGLESTDPIESVTQIPGLPMNLKAWRPGDAQSEGVVMAGGGPGNLKNPKARKLGFAKQATGAAEGYDIDLGAIIENTVARSTQLAAKADMYRTIVQDGLATWGKPGFPHTINGQPAKEIPGVTPPKNTQAAREGQTSLYVDARTYPEIRQALVVDEPTKFAALNALNTVITKAALASTAEFVYHSKNLLTFAIKPGVHPFEMVKNAWDVIRGNKDLSTKFVELARIGAKKDKGMEAGNILPERLKKYDPTYYMGQLLDVLDKTMRLSADAAFNRLAKQGLIENSESNRRNFINQLGQYQRAGQGKLVKLLRDTGLGPFATAGTNYYVQGLRGLTFNPGVKATSTAAAVRLRAEVAARTVAALAAAGLANYLMWGRVDGDENTPLGSIKMDQSNGRLRYFDLTSLTGATRGARETGLLALIEGMRKGSSRAEIVDKGVHDVVHSAMHPGLGPPVAFLYTAATGKNTIGAQVAEQKSTSTSAKGQAKAEAKGVPGNDASQAFLNLQAALWNLNPTIASLAGKDRPASKEAGKEPKTALDHVFKLMGPFGVKSKDVPMSGLVNDVTQGRLKEVGHELPKFNADVTQNGKSLNLTPEQASKYKSYLVEEYDKTVGKWDMSRVQNMKKSTRDDFVKVQLQMAKERAKNRLIHGR